MALGIIQSGADIQSVSTEGVVDTLTLPSSVSLSVAERPRWAVYGNYAIMVNTPETPLTIDATGTVRPLTPKAPKTAPVAVAGDPGGLSGVYRTRFTFVIEDAVGNVIAESDYSPISNAVTLTSDQLKVTEVEISSEPITKRRFYRTTDNGAVFFPWFDLDGNVLTQAQDDLSDAGLSTVGAQTLGTPPRLSLIAEFRGRLFGVGDVDVDNVRYTEAGVPYAWPEDNLLVSPNAGSDAAGVAALVPRREALGVGRRNLLAQITGTGAEDSGGLVDLDMVILSKEVGIESQESVNVFRDVGYFLWKDGVYTWGSEGITCISDGDGPKGNVRSWFATDDFFNREMFPYAFAHINPFDPCYRLFLASAGSNVIDRWVEYSIQNKRWFGPHKTSLFTPTSAFNRTTAQDIVVPVIGGPTRTYSEQTLRTDGVATGIELDVIGKRHDLQAPDTEKYFGELTMLGQGQPSGIVQVVTRAGALDATRAKTQYYDLRKTRQRLGRVGQGKHAQVRLINAQAGVDVGLFGYIIDPVNALGRR